MNTVVLMGRLTADPELRQTTQGTPVAMFTVAVDRHSNDGSADFIRCIAWKKTAEFVKQYFYKGKMIALNGRLQIRQYEDKSHNKREAAEVVAYNVEFCGDKKQSEGYQQMPNYNEPQGFVDIEEGEDGEEDDLPF